MLAARSGAIEWQINCHLVSLSATLTTLFGFPPDSFDGQAQSFLNILDALDRERIPKEIAALPPDATEIETEFCVNGSGRSPRWFRLRGRIERDASGVVSAILGMAQELSPQLVSERRMRSQQNTLLNLLAKAQIDTLPQAEALKHITRAAATTLDLDRASIWTYSEDGLQLHNLMCYDRQNNQHSTLPDLEIAAYPNYFKALLGSRAMAIDHAPTDARTSELNQNYLAPLGITSMLEAPIRRHGKNIGVVCHEHRGTPRNWSMDEQHFAGSIADLVTLALESSERRVLHDALQHQSTHDMLTGLHNRAWLHDTLDAYLANQTKKIALLVFDLDRFKDINDTLGHSFGDQILIDLAARFVKETDSGNSDIARLSGDEFAIVLRDYPHAEAVLEKARQLLALVGKPFNVNQMPLVVKACCGIALAPEHGKTASTLFQRADVALCQAKESSGYQVYQAENDHHTPRHLILMHDLAMALEQNQLQVVFQPKFKLETRTLAGVEALCRWQHDTYGAISPEEFIPLAELSGTIQTLTLRVLRHAAQLWKDCHTRGHDIRIAVNLSPRLLHESGWENSILQTLRETGLPGSAVELEITENAFIREPEKIRASMNMLTSHGVHFSLDDFGAGYSSLAHLSELPLHCLKIDRGLVRKILQNTKHRTIIQATALLGKNLNLSVIAEGIEDAATLDLLSQIGCEYGQGYHLSLPLLPDELLSGLSGWLTNRTTRNTTHPGQS